MTTMEATARRRPCRITLPQITRLVELRRAGLSNAATAIVMGIDFGLDMSPYMVRYYTQQFGPANLGVSRGRVSSEKRQNWVPCLGGSE